MEPSRRVVPAFKGEYRWLSNFWPARVELDDGLVYPSAEHAYVAMKTPDLAVRAKIAALRTGGDAKHFGKSLRLPKDWNDVKAGHMLSILRSKFRDPSLAEKLLSTRGAKLVEGNWWGDRYWGVCSGEGLNTLGELLMQVRRELEELV